jgi:diketogulonate reductase-like aldo/keto reductase
MEKHLDVLLRNAKIALAVDQIELHPHFSKQQLGWRTVRSWVSSVKHGVP